MLQIQYTLKLETAEAESPISEIITAVIEVLNAEKLLACLNGERGLNGRNDYPNRVLWHCLIAFGCLGVSRVTEGLRYLELSAELRSLCGIHSKNDIPTKHAVYRFEKRLVKHLDILQEMFVELVQCLAEKLPGFGERLATDSTKVHSLANGRKPSADEDASWKKYEHTFTGESGKLKKSVVKWFGYKLHLIVDAVYELPLAATFSTARDNDSPHFAKLWKQGKKNLPGLAERAKSNALDKGYDASEVHQTLWHDRVVPLIAIREQTKQENKVLLPENQQLCPDNRPLRFDGFESARNCVRYGLPKTCPRSGDGEYCEFIDDCSQKLQRVKITDEALRHLGPTPRSSKKFARLYKGRTAVERVNGRLKDRWGLDCMRRRGQGRVQMWALLSLLCMNAFAVTMAEQGRLDDVRKTVYSIVV